MCVCVGEGIGRQGVRIGKAVCVCRGGCVCVAL